MNAAIAVETIKFVGDLLLWIGLAVILVLVFLRITGRS
jgi:hypothetical protein